MRMLFAMTVAVVAASGAAATGPEPLGYPPAYSGPPFEPAVPWVSEWESWATRGATGPEVAIWDLGTWLGMRTLLNSRFRVALAPVPEPDTEPAARIVVATGPEPLERPKGWAPIGTVTERPSSMPAPGEPPVPERPSWVPGEPPSANPAPVAGGD